MKTKSKHLSARKVKFATFIKTNSQNLKLKTTHAYFKFEFVWHRNHWQRNNFWKKNEKCELMTAGALQTAYVSSTDIVFSLKPSM